MGSQPVDSRPVRILLYFCSNLQQNKILSWENIFWKSLQEHRVFFEANTGNPGEGYRNFWKIIFPTLVITLLWRLQKFKTILTERESTDWEPVLLYFEVFSADQIRVSHRWRIVQWIWTWQKFYSIMLALTSLKVLTPSDKPFRRFLGKKATWK